VVVSNTGCRAGGRVLRMHSRLCGRLVLPLELETAAQEEFEIYCQHRRDLRRHVYSRDDLRASAAGVVGMGANMAFQARRRPRLGGSTVRLDAARRRALARDRHVCRVLTPGWRIVYTPDEARVASTPPHAIRNCDRGVFGYGVRLRHVDEARARAAGHGRGHHRRAVAARTTREGARRRSRDVPHRDGTRCWQETAGAAFGPICFGYETWRTRRDAAE